jgi:hypothetical protein
MQWLVTMDCTHVALMYIFLIGVPFFNIVNSYYSLKITGATPSSISFIQISQQKCHFLERIFYVEVRKESIMAAIIIWVHVSGLEVSLNKFIVSVSRCIVQPVLNKIGTACPVGSVGSLPHTSYPHMI